MSGTCQAAVPASEYHSGWEECGAPAVDTYSYCCVHEHVVTKATCAEHAPAADLVGCRQCWEAGHDCPMAFQAVS